MFESPKSLGEICERSPFNIGIVGETILSRDLQNTADFDIFALA